MKHNTKGMSGETYNWRGLLMISDLSIAKPLTPHVFSNMKVVDKIDDTTTLFLSTNSYLPAEIIREDDSTKVPNGKHWFHVAHHGEEVYLEKTLKRLYKQLPEDAKVFYVVGTYPFTFVHAPKPDKKKQSIKLVCTTGLPLATNHPIVVTNSVVTNSSIGINQIGKF
jgi:hypothetical protein